MRAVGLIVAAGMARPTQWKIVGVMLSTGFGLGAYTGVKKAIGNRQQALGGAREIAALRSQ
jgi:hypothetical protein